MPGSRVRRGQWSEATERLRGGDESAPLTTLQTAGLLQRPLSRPSAGRPREQWSGAQNGAQAGKLGAGRATEAEAPPRPRAGQRTTWDGPPTSTSGRTDVLPPRGQIWRTLCTATEAGHRGHVLRDPTHKGSLEASRPQRRRVDDGSRGWGEGGGSVFRGDPVSVCRDGKSWRWMVAAAAAQREACLVPLSRAPNAGTTGNPLHLPHQQGWGGTHRAVFERLQDLAPQLSVALVLLDEAALLGREAVGLHLAFLRGPSRGPSPRLPT